MGRKKQKHWEEDPNIVKKENASPITERTRKYRKPYGKGKLDRAGRPVTSGAFRYRTKRRTLEYALKEKERNPNSKLDKELLDQMVELLNQGMTKKAMCEEVGIHRHTLIKWEAKYPELRDAIAEAYHGKMQTFQDVRMEAKGKAADILDKILSNIVLQMENGVDPEHLDLKLSGRDILKIVGLDSPDAVVNVQNIGQQVNQKIVQFVDSDAVDEDGNSVQDRFKQIEVDMEQQKALERKQMMADEGIIDGELVKNEDDTDNRS